MDLNRIVSELKTERDRLSKAIAALEGINSPARNRPTHTAITRKSATNKRRGTLSPEGRKRLSELMKKRWAEKRKKGS